MKKLVFILKLYFFTLKTNQFLILYLNYAKFQISDIVFVQVPSGTVRGTYMITV